MYQQEFILTSEFTLVDTTSLEKINCKFWKNYILSNPDSEQPTWNATSHFVLKTSQMLQTWKFEWKACKFRVASLHGDLQKNKSIFAAAKLERIFPWGQDDRPEFVVFRTQNLCSHNGTRIRHHFTAQYNVPLKRKL